MRNGLSIFAGLVGILVLSWGVLILVSNRQYGALQPYFDETEARSYPRPAVGAVLNGQRVYAQLGCVSCHTQQVRRGADIERGLASRISVARDYIHNDRVLLGKLRLGPDLANVGERRPDAAWHYRHLYDPRLIEQDSVMPSYAFLFQERPIVGEGSRHALDVPAQPGHEIVPSRNAEMLVAYLLSLRMDRDYPEARPPAQEQATE